MKNSKHIINILDETAFADLTEAQRNEIGAHAVDCAPCRKAFQSAQISSVLLKSRMVETFEPPPFFETKVLAALREQKVLVKPMAAFWRWWQASSAVVAMMLISVGVLLAFTFLAPRASVEAQEQTAVLGDLTSERVILPNEEVKAEITNGQALQVIFDAQNSR